MDKQIIIRGGNHMKPRPFYEYFVKHIGKPNPRLLFVGTAGGDSDYFFRLTTNHFIELGVLPHTLSFFNPVPANLTDHVCSFDAIWVGGGNTRSMLAVWKEWGMDKALLAAYDKGILLGGSSAGGLCWFNEGTTDSWAGDLRAIKGCLGILPHSHCPHYDGEEKRRPTYHNMVANGELSAGYAVDDGAAVHFINGKLEKALTLQHGKTAYWVEKDGDSARETALEATLLS